MKKVPKVWVGKELEGYYKGLITLFIGSKSIIYGEIESYVHDFKVDQIYFGAGCCTEINADTVRAVLNNITNVRITIEVDINLLHTIPVDIRRHKTINFIVTNTHKNYELLDSMKKRNIQLKIQTLTEDSKFLSIGSLYHFSEVDMDKHKGETYKGDRVLQ